MEISKIKHSSERKIFLELLNSARNSFKNCFPHDTLNSSALSTSHDQGYIAFSQLWIIYLKLSLADITSFGILNSVGRYALRISSKYIFSCQLPC